MAVITPTGFVKKTLSQIKAEREAAYKLAFGSSLNVVAPSVIATIIGIESDREALGWDRSEECFNSRAPSTAQGMALDNAGELVAVGRLGAKPSQIATQLFFGTVGTVITTSFIASVFGNPLAKFKPKSSVTLIAGTNAVQKLMFAAVPDAGTWTITLGGLTTPNLVFNANAAAVQADVQALDGFAGVTVSGNYTSGFTFTFGGTSGLQPQVLIIATSALTLTSTPVAITASSLTTGVAQGTAVMQAIANGPTVSDTGTLTVIETPVTGLTRTINTVDATLGRNVETDSEYRIRREDELFNIGATTIEAIRVHLKSVLNVREAIVFQNVDDTTDGGGRPPHSVQAFVDGGTDQDVGDELWLQVGGGIKTYGDIAVNVVDSQGLTQVVNFSRPVEVPVYVTYDVTIDPTTFPADGETQIKADTVAFGEALKIGQSVLVYPKMLPAVVDNVFGITDIAIKIGIAPSPTLDDNINFAVNEIGTFSTSNIVVNFV